MPVLVETYPICLSTSSRFEQQARLQCIWCCKSGHFTTRKQPNQIWWDKMVNCSSSICQSWHQLYSQITTEVLILRATVLHCILHMSVIFSCVLFCVLRFWPCLSLVYASQTNFKNTTHYLNTTHDISLTYILYLLSIREQRFSPKTHWFELLRWRHSK